MNGAALERVFRASSGRIIAALAARFRNLALAEDAFSESCLRALRVWPERGVPDHPAAWLYQVANRIVLDSLRRQRVRDHYIADDSPPVPSAEDMAMDDVRIIPDERLRLIFMCCHPAVVPETRAALTLRLICGLTVTEIARAFLLEEKTLAQRLVRAKRKIVEAGVPFELPSRELWPDRLEAVFTTLEVAYAKAHEDAAGVGAHAGFATEVLGLTKLLVELVPESADACALAALVRYAEARRPARVDGDGVMVPLTDQDPTLWRRTLIEGADGFLARVSGPTSSMRRLQAELQRAWCVRKSLSDPPPWPLVLQLYDRLVELRDDAIVRLNRAVAVAEVKGPQAALVELLALEDGKLAKFAPYLAVRADLLVRTGNTEAARADYETLLALEPPTAERRWLIRKLATLH